MKTLLRILLPALLVCVIALSVAEEDALSFREAEPIRAGMEKIAFLFLQDAPEGLRMNVFAGEESIVSAVEIVGPDTVEVTLTRPLKEGESVRVFADVLADGESQRASEKVLTAESLFGPKLPRLRARADAMWPVWQEQWLPAYLEGEVWLRANFRNLPFATFPDEAPEIAVEENDGAARIRFSEPLPEGWSVSTAIGMPVELTPCQREEETGAFTASAGFDSVYLVSEQAAERIGITIVYQRADGFLASYPIVEWIQPDAEDPLAFNCYGFGTVRGFGGGMYAVMGNGAAWYADYDNSAALVSYMDLMTERTWDAGQQLVGGEAPEGFVPPVVIW